MLRYGCKYVCMLGFLRNALEIDNNTVGKLTTEKPVLAKPVAAPKLAIKTSAPAINVSAKDACPRASDKCQREKRKTINGDDLLWATATLGFEDYIEPLKLYLNKYKEMEGETKGSGKGHEGSARKDGVQHNYNEHLAHQGGSISFPSYRSDITSKGTYAGGSSISFLGDRSDITSKGTYAEYMMMVAGVGPETGITFLFDGDKDDVDENAGNEYDGGNMNDDDGKTMDKNDGENEDNGGKINEEGAYEMKEVIR
nr:nuclear transcription factor Y subunit B-10-like isoform X3 [Tanacetum cinerariifolium]